MNPWEGLLTPVADRAGAACAHPQRRGPKRALSTAQIRLVPAAAVVCDKRSGALRLIPVVAADFYASTEIA